MLTVSQSARTDSKFGDAEATCPARTAHDPLRPNLTGLSGRIGIFGGTFDPITNGHLIAALAVKERLNLDALIFAPTGHNPLKANSPLATGVERVRMVCGAVERYPDMFVWPYEVVKDPKLGYFTVDLLRQANREIADPSAKLFFVVGADCVKDLHKWRDLGEIATLAEIVPISRGGVVFDITTHASKALPVEVLGQLERNYLEFDALACSATDARKEFLRGEIPDFLPDSVVEFEKRTGVYRGAAAKSPR